MKRGNKKRSWTAALAALAILLAGAVGVLLLGKPGGSPVPPFGNTQ